MVYPFGSCSNMGMNGSPKRVARQATSEEVRAAAKALDTLPPEQRLSKDAFQRIKPETTFYVNLPKIPFIRPIVALIRHIRILFRASREGVGQVTIITRYAEKASERNVMIHNKVLAKVVGNDQWKSNMPEALARYDKEHTVSSYNLNEIFGRPKPPTEASKAASN